MDDGFRYGGKTYTAIEIEEIRGVIALYRDSRRWRRIRESVVGQSWGDLVMVVIVLTVLHI